MKRSGPLARRTPLRRAGRLRRRRRRDRRAEPGAAEFKRLMWGRCQVCHAPGWVRRHHVVLERHVRAIGADPFDLRNSMLVGIDATCSCHANHHAASHRISVRLVPDEAIRFASELLGPTVGAYLSRFYAP